MSKVIRKFKGCFSGNHHKGSKNTRDRANSESNIDLGQINKQIEHRMSAERRQRNSTIRILLLGTGESGKSTILKQMKKIHNKLTTADYDIMASYIQSGVIQYIKILIKKSFELEQEMLEQNKSIAKEILKQPGLTTQNADMIAQLWADPALKATLALRHKFQIHDNVDWFLNKVHDIAQPSWTPDFEDYIRMRTKTTGCCIEKMKAETGIGTYNFEFTDVGGQRSERKKWVGMMHDQINCALFVVGLSEYNMKCFEDNQTNRLKESLTLFKHLVDKKFLDGKNKSVVLFLNKYDLFLEKIKDTPITEAGIDYPTECDPHDADSVVAFVSSKFRTLFGGQYKSGKAPTLHIHTTTALDTNNVNKIVGNVVRDVIKRAMGGHDLV